MSTTEYHVVCPHCHSRVAVYRSPQQVANVPCAACGRILGEYVSRSNSLQRTPLFVWIGLGFFAIACGGLVFAPTDFQRRPAKRNVCRNRLKQIAIALHNYHDTYRTLPPAYVTNELGEPLYSWRVLVLPFLEQESLYNRFDKSKAWDSPENIAISNHSHELFSCPSDDRRESHSDYFVLVGDRTFFPGKEVKGLAAATDGPSKSLLVIELRGIFGSWAAPNDPHCDALTISTIRSRSKNEPHLGGFNVALGDGSTRFVGSDMSTDDILRAAQIADGNVFDESQW